MSVYRQGALQSSQSWKPAAEAGRSRSPWEPSSSCMGRSVVGSSPGADPLPTGGGQRGGASIISVGTQCKALYKFVI